MGAHGCAPGSEDRGELVSQYVRITSCRAKRALWRLLADNSARGTTIKSTLHQQLQENRMKTFAVSALVGFVGGLWGLMQIGLLTL